MTAPETLLARSLIASSPARREKNDDRRIDGARNTTPMGCANPSGERTFSTHQF
ncbi:uncharacterized protein G2W53_017477 [Senna tora]|uniref:Uncharacterized protein n=1 Tax=Senna tora TaxID=362788 RepID=A0A834TQ14_9FABA|nr:uncharacterized protein G2W53_017477 [Senna tora]